MLVCVRRRSPKVFEIDHSRTIEFGNRVAAGDACLELQHSGGLSTAGLVVDLYVCSFFVFLFFAERNETKAEGL
jgi:hypothetical protein